MCRWKQLLVQAHVSLEETPAGTRRFVQTTVRGGARTAECDPGAPAPSGCPTHRCYPLSLDEADCRKRPTASDPEPETASPNQAAQPARLHRRHLGRMGGHGPQARDPPRPSTAAPRPRPETPGRSAGRAARTDGHPMGRTTGRDGRAPRRAARTRHPGLGERTRTVSHDHLAVVRRTRHSAQRTGVRPGSLHSTRRAAGPAGSRRTRGRTP